MDKQIKTEKVVNSIFNDIIYFLRENSKLDEAVAAALPAAFSNFLQLISHMQLTKLTNLSSCHINSSRLVIFKKNKSLINIFRLSIFNYSLY